MLRFTCECGKQLQAKEEYAGQTTRCPDCGRDLRIPGESTAIQASPTPAERRRAPADEEMEEHESRRAPAATSGKAIASLILGVASFPCSIFTAIPGIILGIWALRDVGASRGRLSGTGLAIGGLVASGLGLVCGVALLPALLLPAVQKVREAATRQQSQNNLKQIAIAFHNYHDVNGKFPPAVVYDANNRPLYSWRVLILPYLEGDHVYRQFKLDEPWDSPNNKSLLGQMPRAFHDPNEPDPTRTIYQVIRGKNTIFENDTQNGMIAMPAPQGRFHPKPAISIAQITDGTSNTLLVVEAEQAVPWSAPEDLDYIEGQPLPRLSKARGGGFGAAFADGSTRIIDKNVDDVTLRLLILRNDNTPVRLP